MASFWPFRPGCGSPCCSPTSPRRWPKGAARPRPTPCAAPGTRCRPRSSSIRPPSRCTNRSRRRCSIAARSPWSRPPTLRKGDVVLVEAGDYIPVDGEVIEGVASVDESAITGESAPVIRESGGDRSGVTGGTRVLSDWLVVRVTANPGETFLDRMIAMVEGAKRQKTPNEIALNILLAGMTIIFLLVCVTLLPFSLYSVARRPASGTPDHRHRAGGPAGVPDPHDHRRAALGHRHRRHGPHDPGQRDRHVGPGGRGGRRRGRAAAGQDRHHHAGQPPGGRVHAGRRRRRVATWPTPPSCPRWPTKRPRAAASSCWPRASTACAAATCTKLHATFIPVHRPDAHERRESATGGRSARARPTPSRLTSSNTAGHIPGDHAPRRRADRQAGRHAAGGGRRRPSRWA